MTMRIEYIGRKPTYKDVLYGTGLTFVPGQVRELPKLLAAKFLRHDDLFSTEKAKAPEAKQDEQVQKEDGAITNAQQGHVTTPAKEQSEPVDDTAAVLEAAQKQQDEQAQKDLERAGLMDQIRIMSKPELQTLAKDRWNQVVHKNLSLEHTRERLIQFVDQYGVA